MAARTEFAATLLEKVEQRVHFRTTTANQVEKIIQSVKGGRIGNHQGQ